jgi:hypothetical protein
VTEEKLHTQASQGEVEGSKRFKSTDLIGEVALYDLLSFLKHGYREILRNSVKGIVCIA